MLSLLLKAVCIFCIVATQTLSLSLSRASLSLSLSRARSMLARSMVRVEGHVGVGQERTYMIIFSI
jgi:hypothetical protein